VLLSPTAKTAIADPNNEVYVSAICAWEIAIKMTIGKIQLADPLDFFMSEGMRNARAVELRIRSSHAVRVASLPLHHRDPFDRLLIAQAATESLAIVSSDHQFKPYGLPVIW
jgi:PIN domain nuclease of toxin-antitoxin system